MITLENLVRRPHVITLVHDTACDEESCNCSRTVIGVTDHDARTGKKTVRAVRKKLPTSVTLLARGSAGGGDVAVGLPHGVRNLPHVKKLLGRGEVKATIETAEEGRARLGLDKKKPTPPAAAAAKVKE